MNTLASLVLLLSILVLDVNAFAKTFEFENALGKHNEELWIWRSNANELKGLHVNNTRGDVIVTLDLCLKRLKRKFRDKDDKEKKTISVTVENIRYSNDGPLDNLRLVIDRNYLASFTTEGDYEGGHGWNKFRDSGRLGPTVELKPGKRQLKIFIQTDMYGVQLDNIRIWFKNQDPTREVFCGSSVRFARDG